MLNEEALQAIRSRAMSPERHEHLRGDVMDLLSDIYALKEMAEREIQKRKDAVEAFDGAVAENLKLRAGHEAWANDSIEVCPRCGGRGDVETETDTAFNMRSECPRCRGRKWTFK